MDYVVIACQTIRDELMKAVNETGCSYPIIWVDSKLHVDPAKLRAGLQQELDGLQGIDCALFAFGSCGNGLVDLHATTSDLIIPKTDDCISMVLSEPGRIFERQKDTYFLTKGWIESSKGLLNEYHYTLQRYGEKRTKRIFDLMLGHYRNLMLIDTEAYDLAEWLGKAEELAEKTNLTLTTTKGSIWFLKQLLTGPYDKNFCYINKGETVNIGHFGYPTKPQLLNNVGG